MPVGARANSDSASPVPPPYAVRISARAKRMQLRITSVGQVEVILPKRMHVRHVPPFVAEHQVWIHQTLRELQQRQKEQPDLYSLQPSVIHLPSVHQTWRVSHCSGVRNKIEVLTTPAQQPHLQITSATAEDTRRVLRQWLMATGKRELLPRFEQVSRDAGLGFNAAGIRRQKTLWGSCSAQKNISLNCNLLFVTPRLMRYVFIHELCHTVYCNHSARFWDLVGRFEPEYKNLDKDLRNATRSIPVWAYS